MPSTFSWLDFSESDQRRAREILQMFSQRESRDELGIGVVRDVFSNLLFPGISVIQTRARYFLYVTWLIQVGVRRGRKGKDLLSWLDGEERRLIETLRSGGDTAGLIGVEAGIAVKILPSTIYWSGLSTYGIIRWPGTLEQIASSVGRASLAEEALTEVVERTKEAWDPEIPAPPAGFPSLKSLDFQMSSDESAWLRERIVATTEGSLLHWLVLNEARPSATTVQGETNWAWTEPAAAGASPFVARALDHAKHFSLAMNGAALLYNHMLADRSEALTLNRRTEDYEALLHRWQDSIKASEIHRWDTNDFWSLVGAHHAGSLNMTRQFVDRWVSLAGEGSVLKGSNLSAARQLVEQRERQQKGARARLTNEKMLRQWTGSSGVERLSYRWFQVIRMLGDLNAEVVTDA